MNKQFENLTLPPANLSVPNGAQWLGIGQTKMWALIRDGEIQPCAWQPNLAAFG